MTRTYLENETITDPKATLVGEFFRGRTTLDFTGQHIKPGQGPVFEGCDFNGDGRSPEGRGGRYAVHLIGKPFAIFTDCEAHDADKLILGGGAWWRGGKWYGAEDGWFFDSFSMAEDVEVERMGHYAKDHVDVLQTGGFARWCTFKRIKVTTSVAIGDCPGYNSLAFLEAKWGTVSDVKVIGCIQRDGGAPMQNGVWLWHDPVDPGIRVPTRNTIAFNTFEKLNGKPFIGGASGIGEFLPREWETQGHDNEVWAA